MMRMPEIVGSTWLNASHITPEELKGKVVLIDFWTYSCVNCLRTLPYLKNWWHKYRDMGFLIIGIHTPEFAFEQDPKNVEQAIRDLGVTWPVVLDNEYVNWENFANHYWPAEYLVDQSGMIVYQHFGEGNYHETEKTIQSLLSKIAKEHPMPMEILPEHEHGKTCFIATPELYCGYLRGVLSNEEGYKHDQVYPYQEPLVTKLNSISLSGQFLATQEYVESVEKGATLFLNFEGTQVNIVLTKRTETAVVEILLNGEKLPLEVRGDDVSEDSTVNIQESRMYNIFLNNTITSGMLMIKALGGNFQAFNFTFSGCQQ